MFSWVIALFVVAIIAAIFGFGGIAASVAGIAQIVFWAALILALVAFVVSRTRSWATVSARRGRPGRAPARRDRSSRKRRATR